jgi:NADH-quinone oxidoreductase subunit E
LLTEEEKKAIQKAAGRYPRKAAASLDALQIVQAARGWVPDAEIKEIAQALDMDPSELEGVATFYSTVFRRPVGRHVIMVCDGISCWVMGYEEVFNHLKSVLGIDLGETAPDNRFTLLPVSCLGLCEQAPAMIIDSDVHGNLTVAKVDDILKRYE